MANKRLAHCVIEGEKQRKGVQLWKKTHHIKRRDVYPRQKLVQVAALDSLMRILRSMKC